MQKRAGCAAAVSDTRKKTRQNITEIERIRTTNESPKNEWFQKMKQEDGSPATRVRKALHSFTRQLMEPQPLPRKNKRSATQVAQ